MLNKIRKLIVPKEEPIEGSEGITDPRLINRFSSDPDFPFLVSFPRTGSHWLRMIMELYFKKPAFTRAFYYPHAKSFTCLHTHDKDLKLERRNVLYLYREPLNTIYSQLNYYKEDITDTGRIDYWISEYTRNLQKWLLDENFTTKKTVIRYDRLKNNMAEEFEKICAHFGKKIIAGKLEEAAAQVSKEKLKEKTRHDEQVVNLTSEYEERRNLFIEKNKERIFSGIYGFDERLKSFF